MNWLPLVISIVSSFVSVLIFGTLAWVAQAWVKSVGESLKDIKHDVHEMKLSSASSTGSQNTRFALVETRVADLVDKITRLEGSTKRLWTKIEPERQGGES